MAANTTRTMYSAPARDQAGAVMLFAVLVLAVMAAIGFVVSSLVYREVIVSRSFDDSLQSYYAAETGIERGLDIVALGRYNRDFLAPTLAAIESYATPASPATLEGSDASYAIDPANTTNTVLALDIPIRQFFQIDLYDPDNSVTVFSNAESMRMQWNISDAAACTASSRMEFTFQEYSSGSIGAIDDSVYKQVYTCGVEPAADGYNCQATSNWPATNTNYIVQIRSLDCPYVDAHIVFYSSDNASGSPVPIQSFVTIASTGSGDLSQRSMFARTKWLPSASGLSAFVLFSLENVAH